jgi:GntR family transcriptional repressor for pyruvate dehydrogenase complex
MNTRASPADDHAARPLAAERLSDRLAAELRQRIDSGALAAGEKLPTEQALATQYAVSRTVVREAVSRLRSMGLVVARQGSGVFVTTTDAARPLAFEPAVLADLSAVLEVVEVRRSLESEVAALAASRANRAQRSAIERALAEVDASVASGSAGIEQDLAFHRAIADASGNSQFPRLLRHLAQYLRHAMAVTRSNESMKAEFIAQVRQEHRAIADAIAARDPDAARAAAANHMQQAARRLQDADAPIRRLKAAAAAAVPASVAANPSPKKRVRTTPKAPA